MHTRQTYTSPYTVAGADDKYEDGSGHIYAGHYISKPVDLRHGNVEIISNWIRQDRHQKQKQNLGSTEEASPLLVIGPNHDHCIPVTRPSIICGKW